MKSIFFVGGTMAAARIFLCPRVELNWTWGSIVFYRPGPGGFPVKKHALMLIFGVVLVLVLVLVRREAR